VPCESRDVVEVTGPTAGAGSVSRRRHPERKVALSKVQKGAAHPQGGVASTSDAVVEEGGACEGRAGGGRADLVTPKPEKATRGVR
jgi:hypothetical protein